MSSGVKARESTKVGYDQESRRIAIDGRGVPRFSGQLLEVAVQFERQADFQRNGSRTFILAS